MRSPQNYSVGRAKTVAETFLVRSENKKNCGGSDCISAAPAALDRYHGRWWICLLSFLGVSVAYLSLAFLLYNLLGIFLPIFPPLLTLLACGFFGFIAQQIHKRSHGMVHG